MGLSIGHILIVLIIVLVLFGAGKLPRVMGDMGKGIRSFKSGLNDRDDEQKRIEDSRHRASSTDRDTARDTNRDDKPAA